MASIGRGARNKGGNYERKIAKLFTERFGTKVKRTGGTERSKIVNLGDINASKNVDTILNDFFWELKCREKWAILDWYKKAKDDAGPYHIPIVVASRNHEDDYAFMKLDHLIRLLVELDGYRREEV